MTLCAICGEEVGARYSRNVISELAFCPTHSNVGAFATDVQTCLVCGQKVARGYYMKDKCPRCHTYFAYAEQAAEREGEAAARARPPITVELEKIGPRQFILFDFLSCIVVGSLWFLVIHFLGRLLTPVGAATVLVVVIVPPLVYAATHRGYHQFNRLGGFALTIEVVDLFGRLGFERIAKPFHKNYGFSDFGLEMTHFGTDNTFFFLARSALARLLMLIVATLLVELFWPGYLHNLIVTAALALPSSTLDTVLFRSIFS